MSSKMPDGSQCYYYLNLKSNFNEYFEESKINPLIYLQLATKLLIVLLLLI